MSHQQTIGMRASLPTMRIVAWASMAAALLGVFGLGLVPAFVSGFVVFHITEGLAAPIERRVSAGKARALAVTVVGIVVIGALVGAALFLWRLFDSETGGENALLMRLMHIIDASRNQLPDWLVGALPTDPATLREMIYRWADAHAAQIDIAGSDAIHVLVHALAGMVIGAMVALHRTTTARQDAASGFRHEMIERAGTLSWTFSEVLGAQVKISAINAGFTALFLMLLSGAFWIQVPLAKSIVVLTFVFGLIPVVGNLISNTILTILALSVSFETALAALGFLVVIHKFEYFLNAKIMGDKLKASAWEILLAMLVLQAAFGLAGLMLAPIVYGYVKNEFLREHDAAVKTDQSRKAA
jgi:predicted PurR-regulated permease PerM